MLLVAEATAHVGTYDADVGLVEAADLGDDAAQLVGLLAGGHHGQPSGACVPGGLGAVTFEGQAAQPVALERHLEPARGGRQSRIESGGLTLHGQELVGAPFGVQQRGPGLQGGIDADHRWKLVIVDDDRFQGVLGCGARDRDDRGEGLADKPDRARRQDAPSERPHRRPEQVVKAPRAGGLEVLRGDHGDHAGHGVGRGGVDRSDAGVGDRRPGDGDVAQGRDWMVGQVPSPSAQQTRPFPAQIRRAQSLRRDHASTASAPTPGPARRPTSTMAATIPE